MHFVVASDDVVRARRVFPPELHQFASFVERGGQAAQAHSHAATAVEDLAVLALCCEHSLVSVGSYGWWAAFLRERRRLADAGWSAELLRRPERFNRTEVHN